MKTLEISNFKGFNSLAIDLGGLSLLTGHNSAGKSTINQALVLMELARTSRDGFVDLNGPFGLALGETAEVLNAEAADNLVSLTVTHDNGDFGTVRFRVDEGRSLELRIEDKEGVLWRSPRRIVDNYLSAERLGPRDLLELEGREVAGGVGARGEYAAHVLARDERRRVPEPLQHPSTSETGASSTLGAQVGLWLSDIVSPTLVQATWLAGTSAATIRFRRPGAMTEWLRPANVGFGLSYALPILVASLLAEPGSVLIVENPEAHLHPAGQSRMGRFLGRLAGYGVECVVESHSDHVLNGMRLAAATDQTLSPDLVRIHFFAGEQGHIPVGMGPGGRLQNWPSGFFDQLDDDLATLSRTR